MLIRPYQECDYPDLEALWNNVFSNPRPHNHPRQIVNDKLAVQPQLLFVAEEEATIIGSIIAGYDGHRGWLNLVAVLPDHQGQGIGRQLVEHAIAALHSIGCKKVNIQIREGNEAVIQFYQRLGFETEPRVSMARFVRG